MSQCFFSSVPALSFICELYLEQKIKRILALSLNWKVNFKLLNPEMGQNRSMYVSTVVFNIWF